jgi:hypothetical protein
MTTMTSFAIGIGGLVAAVLVLRGVASRWMKKECADRELERKSHHIVAAEIVDSHEDLRPGRVVHLRF